MRGARTPTLQIAESGLIDSRSIVAETAGRIFADLADPQSINRARDDRWKGPLWRALAEAGLTLAWVPEQYGGSDGTLADGFEVIGVAGRHASPVALPETLLGGWLLSQAGLSSPPGMLTVAPARPRDRIALNADGTLSGRANAVPFARDASHIAVLASDGDDAAVALVATADCRLSERQNLAGDPADTIVFERTRTVRAATPVGFDQSALMLMGAVVRSIETAGALEALLAMSVRYANERIAFEKPIGRFQAVQQNLARLAGEVAAALVASGSAADAVAQSEPRADALLLEAAAAKIRAAEAAAEGAAIAHQVHGAMGFTQEHVLHRYTLRLLSWRDDFGDESYWAVKLGALVARNGADQFWPMIAAR
jgi:alkylation response protein AidB-like acyl-CoA dehydrogenase